MGDLTDAGAPLFGTILADPPWRFENRTGKVAPEHTRLYRYTTLPADEICSLRVQEVTCSEAHLYLWVPNALVKDGLRVMEAWGFAYKTNLVWHKVRKDGLSDGSGVGFYFRNVTELVLFGVRGTLRTAHAGRRQVNLLASRKRGHSRKPDELYGVVEACSPGPYLELFARSRRAGWWQWGNEAPDDEEKPVRPELRERTGRYRVSMSKRVDRVAQAGGQLHPPQRARQLSRARRTKAYR